MAELLSQYPLAAALLALVGLAAVFGAVLGFAAIKFKTEGNPIVDQINDILPQTQCGQCGYPGCRPYAEALIRDQVAETLCPPGGPTTAEALRVLLAEERPVTFEAVEEFVRRDQDVPAATDVFVEMTDLACFDELFFEDLFTDKDVCDGESRGCEDDAEHPWRRRRRGDGGDGR